MCQLSYDIADIACEQGSAEGDPSRIQEKVEYEVAEEQAGFRPGQGTRNHLCSLRLITERARAHRQLLYMCFVDFEKAFDTVSHKKLWTTMVQMGFAPHIVSLIRSRYECQKSCVRASSGTSEWFDVLRGVRQGCTLSPYLFNIIRNATRIQGSGVSLYAPSR